MNLKDHALDYAFIFLTMSFTFAGVMVFFLFVPSIEHLLISSIIAIAVASYGHILYKKDKEIKVK